MSNSCFLFFWSSLVADVNMKLKLGSGLVIGVPIPREHAASGRVIESAIQSALREARSELVFALKYYKCVLVLEFICC